MGEILGGNILLVYNWIEGFFSLTIYRYLKGFTMIYFVVKRFTQQKLFKGNEGSGEHKLTIAAVVYPGRKHFNILPEVEVTCLNSTV